MNAPLGLAALALAYRCLPADPPRGGRATRFDVTGTILLALAAYALAMTPGRDHFGALNAGLLLAAARGAWLFLRLEARAAAPLLRPALLRQAALTAGLATNALVSTVMMATLVVGPFYLARALGLDAAAAGLAMSAGPLVSALSGVPAGGLVDRRGPGRVAHAGLAAAPTSLGLAGYIAPIVLLTAGYVRFQAAKKYRHHRRHRRRPTRVGGGHAESVAQPWPSHGGLAHGGGIRLRRGRAGSVDRRSGRAPA